VRESRGVNDPTFEQSFKNFEQLRPTDVRVKNKDGRKECHPTFEEHAKIDKNGDQKQGCT
jgi:hypothetical protein